MATLVGSTLFDQYYIRAVVRFRWDGGYQFGMGYHATIICTKRGIYTRDGNSTVGIMINGQRISATICKPGDHIQTGINELEFYISCKS
jgi:hypothetical protein